MTDAAAQPYQECSELVCTTSIDNDRMRLAIRVTATGHPTPYCAHVSRPCEVEIRSIGTMCTAAPAASSSARRGGSAGTTTWHSNSPAGRLANILTNA